MQSGGDLRQALLTLLGLESAVNFNVDDLAGARPGQHAVQVWEVTAQSAEDAAALAASQIRAVLEQLKSNGVTEGRIGMVEVDGKYYVVVDVEVTEENTFEPIRPVSDDDDSEDTPSVRPLRRRLTTRQSICQVWAIIYRLRVSLIWLEETMTKTTSPSLICAAAQA